MITEQDFLRGYSIKDYDRPSVAADLVIFRMRTSAGDNFRKDPKSSLSLLLTAFGDYRGAWYNVAAAIAVGILALLFVAFPDATLRLATRALAGGAYLNFTDLPATEAMKLEAGTRVRSNSMSEGQRWWRIKGPDNLQELIDEDNRSSYPATMEAS